MKLWIIGAQGFVGSELFHLAKSKGYDVVGTSHEECDVTDPHALKKWAERIQPTHMVNCVAFTNVDAAEKEPSQTFLLNRDVPTQMAIVAKEKGIRLIHISTDYVFGGETRDTPYKESDSCSPVNTYGVSKREGEIAIQKVLPSACIVRTSWVFDLQGRNFMASFLRKMKTEKQVEVVKDQVGQPTYCPDLALALLKVLDQEGIVHFSNEGILSRYDAIMTLWTLAKQKGIPIACQKVIPVLSSEFPAVARRPSYSALDTSLYTQLTGDHPRFFRQTLEECLSHAI